MSNNSIRTGGAILGMVVVLGSVLLAWGDVKNKANTNEKNHIEFKQETRENIKEIKADQKTTLIKITELLTIAKERKESK